MSKASEWAATAKAEAVARSCTLMTTIDRFCFGVGISGLMEIGMVSDDGRRITVATARPEAALELAQWILDTFGESR